MEYIFTVGKDLEALSKVKPVSFADIGIRERQDLEKWIANNPDLLGEPFLTVTTEYAQFRGSSRRLDVLALDKEGKLTVIELKLDASGGLADLQAIRYAAFVSTMLMKDVVAALAERDSSSEEDATKKILDFLELGELPAIDDRPRIVLAAGSFDDVEITSSVLWLRKAKVDISCVELTPYVLSPEHRIVIVPRTIIPIPEARKYMVDVERKEAEETDARRELAGFARFWRVVASEFNKLDTPFHMPETLSGSPNATTVQLSTGFRGVHYEWRIRKKHGRVVYVSLDLELQSREENLLLLAPIREHEAEIHEGVQYQFCADDRWGARWAAAHFSLPFEGDAPDPRLGPEAARVMKLLIERTWPLIQPKLKK